MTPTTTTTTKTERCPNAKRAFNSQGEIIQMACDMWDCDHCGKILAWRWAQRIRYGIALWPDHRAWFWTLTLPGWVPDAKTGYKVLPARWKSLRQTLRRANNEFQYAAFVEAHPHRAFIPHFHIITLHKAPERFKDMAVHAGFGHQAKELEINGKMAVNYVCKYASKGQGTFPRNFRRVRISQAWPELPTPVYEYQVYPIDRGEALSRYFQRMSATLGYPVDLLRDRWLDHSRDVL
jgi:hypothetical protein